MRMSAPTTENRDPAIDPRREKRSQRARRIAETAGVGWKVLLLKIVAMAIIDALALYSVLVLMQSQQWVPIVVILLITGFANYIYFSRGNLPAKYLIPGLIFLFVFQIFAAGYTAYVAFTNYGTGHNSDKDAAVNALLLQAQERVPDSPAYKLTIVEQLGELSFLVTDPDGGVEIGNDENPLEPVENAQMDGGKAVGLDGYNSFTFADIVANQQQIAAMAVQISEDPNDGSLRTPDGSSAYVYLSKLVYDEQADTMTDTRTGTVYYDIGTGAFTAEDGTELLPGWQIFVGFDNFTRAFTEESIRGPFFSVLIWTFVFAFLSVATTFVLGLFLAIVFNDPRMKSKKYYRVLMILPYAFPGFLSALVWAGMMNQEFGFINVVLFGGADIPWLTNEWLAKFSIILVNLWLGFPYMFLICTGALQSIPDDLQEAARVDGANAWQVFRSIKFPLLLVAVAPLLIASFAYNFNNFSLIYMLTGGGPRDATAGVNVGATDILITMVYKVAFVGSTADYGLASAFSIIIFLIVGTISIIAFRQTKALEELN
ncbi:MAG: maltose ABC transporter permease [Actinobacteria bacterium]|jgi:arabinogalactan oligomer / maltooligosaccharide transport system permease protein|nr:maltose ABC transporter permease [Microbacterium sp.]RCL86825.1 MAG: ABC transporter permease subunit [Microbacterium sp.]RUA26265.1 MAG: maltose ABC transporter permease [Actinomycetota bacterium]HBU41468.1 maltose ABC transporter permease [Microbacterium sp.]HCM49655.1 maltose ABC transporter permease [Microbacterium sp.]